VAIKTELHHLQEWAQKKTELERQLRIAVEYRDRQIASRDRKASQISLADREERMWQKRIDAAQEVVDRIERQLALLNT
jgi:hypothetical protein